MLIYFTFSTLSPTAAHRKRSNDSHNIGKCAMHTHFNHPKESCSIPSETNYLKKCYVFPLSFLFFIFSKSPGGWRNCNHFSDIYRIFHTISLPGAACVCLFPLLTRSQLKRMRMTQFNSWVLWPFSHFTFSASHMCARVCSNVCKSLFASPHLHKFSSLPQLMLLIFLYRLLCMPRCRKDIKLWKTNPFSPENSADICARLHPHNAWHEKEWVALKKKWNSFRIDWIEGGWIEYQMRWHWAALSEFNTFFGSIEFHTWILRWKWNEMKVDKNKKKYKIPSRFLFTSN